MKLLMSICLACACVLSATAAADDTVSETRAIDARVVRVKLDGLIELKLRQGKVASLTISGDKRSLVKITTLQSGDTLHIDSETQGLKMNHPTVHVELVLPALRELTSEGVGSSDVGGFSGNELELSLDGAGSMKIVADYKKVKASLAGIGHINLWVSDSDSVDLDLGGAGYITLGGRSKALKATLAGLGGLNAQQFQADSVNLDLSGLGSAVVTARKDATLNLSGLGSVTVYGKPVNRNVSVDGLGSVNWK